MKAPVEPVAPPHASLGRVLAVRQRRAFFTFLALLMGPLGALVMLAGIAMLLALAINGSRTGPRAPGGAWLVDLAMLGVGLGLIAGARAAFRRSRTKVVFHELGAVRVAGKRAVVIPYAEADQFMMKLEHQSYNGMYAGTVVRLMLHAPGGRQISYTGGYKVKARGFLQRSYEMLDELEGVRHTIAEQMADTFIDRMLAGEALDWCGRAALTPEGLVPAKGRRRGEAVPYASIDRQVMRDAHLQLFAGDRRALATIEVGGTNFWPVYAAFLRMAQLQEVGELLPGTESEEGDDVEDDD